MMRNFTCTTVDVVYENAGYKNPDSIYRIFCILLHLIFAGDKTIPCRLWGHAGYKNIILDTGCHIPYIVYASYKNMFLDN